MYFYCTLCLQGKVKPVTERTAGTDLLEPTPNFDCHISRSIQNLPANTPLSQLFDYSQVPLSSLSFLPVFVTGFIPGSHMPLLYLRHIHEYCLHYCCDIWEHALPFNKKHCMSLPLECLWSWTQVNFASMSAVKTEIWWPLSTATAIFKREQYPR